MRVLNIDDNISVEFSDDKFSKLETRKVTYTNTKETFNAVVFNITDKNIIILADEKLFERKQC